MDADRKRIFIGLAVAMFLGSVVYMRLWTIDFSMSSGHAELLRFGFSIFHSFLFFFFFSHYVGSRHEKLFETSGNGTGFSYPCCRNFEM